MILAVPEIAVTQIGKVTTGVMIKTTIVDVNMMAEIVVEQIKNIKPHIALNANALILLA